jgi:hypothetical protein
MTFSPLDPLSWIPDATKREILDGLLKFMMDKAENAGRRIHCCPR